MDEQDFAPRIDMRGFTADMAAMRADLSQGLGDAAELGARSVEGALLRAARTGRFGFEELKATALSALDQIARAALRQGVGAVGDGGLLGLLGGLASGLPGRATGGPVSPDRPYLVGERGPEVFVPTSSGRVEPLGRAASPRDVRVAITINAGAGEAAGVLQRSGRQVARAVRAALAED
ncbi:phage-related minor tail protein [Sphingomonas sp. SORGH_AS 950]|uniref:tail tape measure protein n=1 Tax=Sphingomonas sp. SORGH_AS_0950 TaxID=3041792 RepID=UPI00278A0171|nr:tail tape measure protein [Sphingomonas sp. SORGH_AS_0950]MDQ1158229.1 phage-related minor tail protein [Sphingomonas sp. SORGH_AS_0950]